MWAVINKVLGKDYHLKKLLGHGHTSTASSCKTLAIVQWSISKAGTIS